MHPYIPHLISDIKAAHRTDFPPKKEREMTIEEQFDEIDRWVSGVDERPFSDMCGLTHEIFPPASQLTDKETDIIISAFEKMMHTWDISVDLPRNVPTHIAYELITGLLNRETGIVGGIIIDFCTGYAPDCELKEYCPCLKIWNDEDKPDVDRDDK